QAGAVGAVDEDAPVLVELGPGVHAPALAQGGHDVADGLAQDLALLVRAHGLSSVRWKAHQRWDAAQRTPLAGRFAVSARAGTGGAARICDISARVLAEQAGRMLLCAGPISVSFVRTSCGSPGTVVPV